MTGGIHFLISDNYAYYVRLHYDRLGHGPHILLAFHGAGQTGRACFQPFADHLSQYYTIYAFDLFFHGQSPGTGDEDSQTEPPITKSCWKQMVEVFLDEKRISRFDVAGFSLGGRFAMATAEALPGSVDRLILMAPDGVMEHSLYRIATRHRLGRWLYRQLTHRPEPFFTAAALIEKGRILPRRTVRFVRHMMQTPEQRRQIYNSWICFRTLSFSIPTLYDTLRSYRVDVWLFVGKYDPMLPARRFRVLSDRLASDRFVILESGHTRLVEKAAVCLASLLK
jgi:pimeloyl-ACP methyl ester carboxylesterase